MIKIKNIFTEQDLDIFNFEEKPYYKASAGAEKVPEVDFSK